MREVAGIQAEVAPKQVSRKNTGVAVVGAMESPKSSRARFVARELNSTKRPSGLMAGEKLPPLASEPSTATERRVVAGKQVDEAPIQVSRRKMSLHPLLSPFTKLLASDSNTTKRPSAVAEGERLGPLGSVPFHPTEMETIRGTQPAALRQVSRKKILAMPVAGSTAGSMLSATKG